MLAVTAVALCSVSSQGQPVLAELSLPLIEKRHFHLHECERHFRESFQSYVLATLRKSIKICLQEEAESLLFTKTPWGAAREPCVFAISPRASFSVHNGVRRVKRKEKGLKRGVGTRVVTHANSGLQWIRLLHIDRKKLRKMAIVQWAWLKSKGWTTFSGGESENEARGTSLEGKKSFTNWPLGLGSWEGSMWDVKGVESGLRQTVGIYNVQWLRKK